MSPRELAERYLDIFYSGSEIGRLRGILAHDVIFRGPFFTGTSREEYMASLESDPPVGMSYRIRHIFESERVCCVVYDFQKGDIEAAMCQVFETDGRVIERIELIFDSTGFGD